MNTRLLFKPYFVAVLFALPAAISAPAYAAIIDQSNVGDAPGGAGIGPNSPIGQSFTPTLPGIDFATFLISDVGSGQPGGSMAVEVRAGVNGALLGTSQVVNIADDQLIEPAEVQFNFASTVVLVPTQLYSLILIQPTGAFGASHIAGNPYAGGSLILSGGAIASHDLYFFEGIVPEPGGVTLAGIGLLGAARMLRRRKTLATDTHRMKHGRMQC